MLETYQIVILVFLIVVLVIASWWFAVAYRHGTTLNDFSYTRGANLDTGTVGNGNTGIGEVDLKCGPGTEICVYKATGICSGALNATTNVEGGIEPISADSATYGNFDPNTTIDLTADLSKLANGQQTYNYNFNASQAVFGGKVCPFGNYNQKNNIGPRPQFISTYTCIPKGSSCTSSIS
jgi:hypothetical protein